VKKLIFLLVIAAIGVAAVLYWRSASAANAAPTSASVDTVKVARGNIFQAVASTGQVVSNLDVDIKCRASGQVTKLPFDISQQAKAGDVLLQLDPRDEQRAVKKAEVQLAQSVARLEQAKQNLNVAQQNLITNRAKAEANLVSSQVRANNARARAERQRQLVEQNLGSKEEYESSQTEEAQAQNDLATANVAIQDLKTQEIALNVKAQDIKLAEAQVQSDQIALDDANQRLEYTTVTAPMDGVISAQAIQIGTIIASATSNVSGGTTIMVLSDLSKIFVLASVDESDIGKVQIDQDVMVTADAYPGERFRGKIVRIATKGVNTSNVVTFECKIEITSPNKRKLKPMMTTNVQIVAAQKDDVLTVPVGAVQRKGRELFASVVDAPGKQPTSRPVQVGMTDGEQYEVVAGLAEGDTVQVQKGDVQSRWNGGGAMRMGGMMMGGGGGGGSRGGGGGGGGGRGR
jgi:HlyD family secretion protein